MKRELRRQLGEEHVYIDEMYDKWQRAAQRINQTGKEFIAYLQSIRLNLLDLDAASAPNKTQFIYRIRQGLRSEICSALCRNLTVSKNWLIFFEAVARAESFIHLDHISFLQLTQTSTPAEKKLAESTTNQNLVGQTSRDNHSCGNF